MLCAPTLHSVDQMQHVVHENNSKGWEKARKRTQQGVCISYVLSLAPPLPDNECSLMR